MWWRVLWTLILAGELLQMLVPCLGLAMLWNGKGLWDQIRKTISLKKTEKKKTDEEVVPHSFLIARITQALVGALYEEKGALETRKFVHNHFLSRSNDLTKHLHLMAKTPRRLLLLITDKLNKPRPISRILKETGSFHLAQCTLLGCLLGILRSLKDMVIL